MRGRVEEPVTTGCLITATTLTVLTSRLAVWLILSTRTFNLEFVRQTFMLQSALQSPDRLRQNVSDVFACCDVFIVYCELFTYKNNGNVYQYVLICCDVSLGWIVRYSNSSLVVCDYCSGFLVRLNIPSDLSRVRRYSASLYSHFCKCHVLCFEWE